MHSASIKNHDFGDVLNVKAFLAELIIHNDVAPTPVAAVFSELCNLVRPDVCFSGPENRKVFLRALLADTQYLKGGKFPALVELDVVKHATYLNSLAAK